MDNEKRLDLPWHPNVTRQTKNHQYFCFVAQGGQGKDSDSFCHGHFCSKLH